MRRRLFNVASVLSLLLCVGTVVLWVRSYMDDWDPKVNGLFNVFAVRGYEFISGNGRLSLFHFVPDGVTQIDFVYWRWVMGFGALPAVWLGWRLRARRRSPDGCCTTCGYNLRGNVSGTCPECGAACKAADPAGVSPAAGD